MMSLSRLIIGIIFLSLASCSSASNHNSNLVFETMEMHGDLLNSELFGLTKKHVLERLGEPMRKNYEEWPYTHQKGEPHLRCDYVEECEKKFSNERWTYKYYDKIDRKNYSITFHVFFKNDNVVAVR